MAKKKPQKNTAHKTAVERTAEELSKQGWDVKADHISKYPDPDVVNGRIPDLVATKNGRKRVYEVETGKGDDLDQRTDLYNSAVRSKNTKYFEITTNKAGDRIDMKENEKPV